MRCFGSRAVSACVCAGAQPATSKQCGDSVGVLVCLVVAGHLAAVRGGLLVLEHLAVRDLAVHHPVVRRLHAAHHLALHERRRLLEDGRAARRRRPLHAGEAVGAGGEAGEEVLHQGLEPRLRQAVEHEGVAHLHQALDGAVLGDGHGEAERLEGGLRDPRRHHGGARVALRRRHHIQPAGHAPQRLGHVRRHGALHALQRLLLGQHLPQVRAALLELLVRGLRGAVPHAQRRHHLLHADAGELHRQSVHRLVHAAVALADEQLLLGLDAAEDGAQGVGGGARGGRRQQHDAAGAPHRLDDLLRVRRVQVHHDHLHVRLGQPARDALRQPVAEPVVAGVEHRRVGHGLLQRLLAPPLVVRHQLLHVELEQRAVAVADGHEVRALALALAQRRQHGARVGLHQALVVEAVVRHHGAQVGVEHLLGAVVRAEGVARVHQAAGGVVREHGVRPVQVGRHDELELVPPAQVDHVAALHRLRLERLLHQVGEERQAHLGAQHHGVGRQLQDVADEPGVVRLGVAAHDVVDGGRVHHARQRVDVQLLELGMAGVHQGHLLRALDHVRVVRRALAAGPARALVSFVCSSTS
mmetsp:Transcript_5854/g.14866  ORF Transcript_5854/g.14866 Transcript_5854/m.14866 type:complete len:584 (-) Transcript_5854:293-2044(-)